MNALADAKSIFANALDLPLLGRATYLDAACGGDAALHAEVAELLAADAQAGDFLKACVAGDGTLADAVGQNHTPLEALQPQPGATVTFSGAPVPGSAALVLPPSELGGYRIERLLGAGGMGAVYLARDDKLGRAVALKTMRPEIAVRLGATERFLREARATAQVAHDNVVPILHVGDDAGIPYIAMPLLEGQALDRFLERVLVPPLGMALKIGCETADGLAAAHACGLVHRDIKPANIWLEGDAAAPKLAQQFRRVKVLDFGLARSAADNTPLTGAAPATDDTQLTSVGAILGTPAYMSPEQARGTPVDGRTDLFSLGVVLYRLTTGALPFAGETAMAVLASVAVDDPVPPVARNPRVPPALSDLIMRLLEKDRTARPGSAAEVATLLRAIGKQLAPSRSAGGSGPRTALSSPQPSTEPGDPQFNPDTETDAAETTSAPAKAPRVPPRKAKPRGPRVWAATGLVSLLAFALAGVVVIKIVRAGKETTLEVPDGSTVLLDEDGNPTVKLPNKKVDGPPTPIDDRKAAEDRKAAAWVLSIGGTVRVTGNNREIKDPADLPKGPFRLTEVRRNTSGKVTDAGLAALAGCTELSVLDLNASPVGDAGLAHLKSLTGLTELHLGRTRVTDAGLVHLKGLTGLTYLTLSDNPEVGGAGLDHLKGLKGLTRLNLNGSGTTDAGVAHLAGLTNLTHLYLCGLGVTAPALAHLKGLKELRWLELNGQPVGDAGLEHLAALTHLTHLDVRDVNGKTGVTAAGVAKLAKARPRCAILWAGGTVKPTAALDRAAAEWVVSIGGTVTIKDAAGVREVGGAKGLPAGPFVVTAASFARSNNRVADADLARLAELTELAAVSLYGTSITDAGLEHLKGVLTLTDLSLAATRVTDAGVAHLAGLKRLTKLYVEQTRITDAGLAHLKGLPALTFLKLDFTAVTDAGLVHLKPLKLTDLFLSGTAVTDGGVAPLAAQVDLTTLSLDQTRMTAAGITKLQKMLPKCHILAANLKP